MLVVDDDEGLRPSIELSLGRRGFDVVGAATVAEARELLRERHVALALLDINLPDGSGLDILKAARETDPEIAVVMMTAYPELKTAIRAMREGASDYIVKPFELEDLHMTVDRAFELRSLRRDVERLKRERRVGDSTAPIFGDSLPIRAMREQITKVAPTDAPVLVLGETGTGKELVADAIHAHSERKDGPLVKVNCSTFSEALLESELFGHVRGAFTDAKQAREGLFEMADGGTLFLDEISEMKLELQTKLLRVVEGRQSFRRVGGSREIRTNVRLVAATNRDLEARVRRGDFREDLYFRLNVFPISVPPLRSRGDDIVLLARRFALEAGEALRKGPITLSESAEEYLLAYSWPGNVRELKNLMERGAILADGPQIDVAHLPAELQSSAFIRRSAPTEPSSMPALADIERKYVEFVCESVGGNLSRAARILGIARNTLKSKIKVASDEADTGEPDVE